MTALPDYPSIARAALIALREGRAAEARRLFEQVTAVGRGDASVWIGLAYACQSLGDNQAVIAATDQALRLEPANARALILKGDHFASLGDRRSASTFYTAALKSAPASAAPDLQAELRRVSKDVEALAGGFETFFDERVDLTAASARFLQSLDLMQGRSALYLQQPRYYYFPGLPQIQFAPREATPFLADVEAAHTDIKAELQAVLAEPDLFAPYVEIRENRPNNHQAGMLENAEWSALYLVKDGAPIPEMQARFPCTMAALANAPLTDIAGRAPSVLFSKLTPGAHIPPHHGLVNTRLICHLAVIAPEACSFRVGSETRPWIEARAWAFDDTIEHEAWNRSEQDRIVLIFDVWKPEITEAERSDIRSLFAAINAYGGGPETWGV